MNGATKIGQILNGEGYQAYLVGGCVRDTLLKIKPKDFDVATDARPNELIAIAEKYNIQARAVGESFGVVLFILDEGTYEVATFREDGTYSDKRRPDSVEYFDTIEYDLARRDFTINAMAIDMKTGDLVDPFNGKADLAAGILRTVGNSEDRFNEDHLRIIRFFRFAARFNLIPDQRAMKEIARDPNRVHTIANERIGMEIEKILMLPVPSRAFKLMIPTGVFKQLFPELDILKVIPQSAPHSDSVLDHTFKTLDYAALIGADYATRMAAFLHDCGKADAFSVEDRIRFMGHSKAGGDLVEMILDRLKASNKLKEDVKELVHYHMTLHHVSTKGLFKRYINKMGIEQTERLLMLNLADMFDSRITGDDLAKIDRFDQAIASLKDGQTKFELKISGRDIMHYLNLETGPLIGKIKSFMEYLLAEEVIKDNRGEQIIFLQGLKEFISG